MREMLQSPKLRQEISALAEAIGETARVDGAIIRHKAEIKVEHYTTDRAASAVLIKKAEGLGIEAKYAPLKKAAAAKGLKVKSAK